jgi:hypothetical protein
MRFSVVFREVYKCHPFHHPNETDKITEAVMIYPRSERKLAERYARHKERATGLDYWVYDIPVSFSVFMLLNDYFDQGYNAGFKHGCFYEKNKGFKLRKE